VNNMYFVAKIKANVASSVKLYGEGD